MVDGIRIIEFELPYGNKDRFLKRALTFFKYAWKSLIIALREPCDLVFATSTPLTAAIPGIVAKTLRRKPFVFEVRDLWPELPRAMGVITNPAILGLLAFLEWAAYRAADTCIGLSPGIVEGIRRRARSGLRVVMIPNGSDIHRFGGTAIPAEPWPDIPPESFVAVFAGAHGLANGLDSVLDAAKVLKRRDRSDIRIVLVGNGMKKASLQARAEQEMLDNVTFFEPVPKPTLMARLRGSSAGLMVLANVPAFFYGTSPNKFFDYIAVGLPVLNNYPGWLADMINERRNGLAVEADNPRAFADALEFMADDPDRLARMGAASQSLAMERFSRQKLASDFVAELERAAGPGG